ncbi:hypothetical protein BDV98DRAFT_571736 [Pterulicium gracile]|uniref:Uncharacterized protein n=1 Tax=Pterulicium gracile TaxID=1884261 RepID=A0A5C3QBL1_9AGAR|nr:hypothetical protein BDV98DRAFT_571736 [Pterula gracilis]
MMDTAAALTVAHSIGLLFGHCSASFLYKSEGYLPLLFISNQLFHTPPPLPSSKCCSSLLPAGPLTSSAKSVPGLSSPHFPSVIRPSPRAYHKIRREEDPEGRTRTSSHRPATPPRKLLLCATLYCLNHPAPSPDNLLKT